MAEELGTRDVVEQLDKRLDNLEQGQHALVARLDKMNDKMDDRFDRINEKIDDRFDRINEKIDDRFDQLRSEMNDRFSQIDSRFGRLNATMVTVLLALVIGVGGLWLR